MALLLLSSSISVNAGTIPVVLEFEVVGADPDLDQFSIGDRYTIALTIDLDIQDTDAESMFGFFDGAIMAATLTGDPSNVGWNPGSGTLDLMTSSFVTQAGNDTVQMNLRGQGFPPGGPGRVFFDITLAFGWAHLADVTDSGSGDTLTEQLGGITFGVPPATIASARISFVTDSGPPVLSLVELGEAPLFRDGFESGSTEGWIDVAALPDCNCRFSSDCPSGNFCD